MRRRPSFEAREAFLLARRAGALPIKNPSDAVFLQPFWQFDAVNGNDRADGITAPLKTFGEYFRRTGLFRPVNIALTLQMNTDMPETDPILLSHVYGLGGSVSVVGAGSDQVLHSGQLTAAVNLVTNSPPSGQITIITDPLVSSWTPFVGKQVVLTSGPNAGGGFIVKRDLGGGQAEVSVPNVRNANTPSNNTLIALAGNETYQILARRLLGAVLLLDVGSFTFAAAIGPPVPPPAISFRLIKTPTGALGGAPHSVFAAERGVCQFYDCEITAMIQPQSGGVIVANNCYITTAVSVGSYLSFNYGLVQNASWVNNGGVSVADFTIFDHCTSGWNQPSHFHAHHPIGIYNSNAFLTVDHGSSLVIRHGLFGSGNTTCIVWVRPGSKVITSTLDSDGFSVSGSGGGYSDILFGSAGSSRSTAFAVDSTTGQPIAGARNLSFANYVAAVGSGGFGSSIVDALAPGTGMTASDGF